MASSALLGGADQLGKDLYTIAHDSEAGVAEDGGVGILVDGHDGLGGRTSRHVLAGPRDSHRHVQGRASDLAREADLLRGIDPAVVDQGSGRTGQTPQYLGQLFDQLVVAL